jgi:hypothetical protein
VLAAIFMFTKVSIKRNENAIAGMINVTWTIGLHEPFLNQGPVVRNPFRLNGG